ncbi:MAG TPA: TIGR03790 family protein, partial [Vicinamibacterales bacterium]|nr:TIGR03790 family protein [Vicinamibacterales bacterium]
MKRELGVTTACLTLLIVFLGGRGSSAQSAENVLVVANATSPLSNEIADYYVQKRQIPSEQVLRLKLPLTEEIQRPLFELEIERPIAQWLTAHSAEDRILYLVLTKDVPIRIAGTVGMNGTAASVDSELTLLYRRLVGGPVAVAGSIANPYFLGDATVGDARAFTHEKQDLYLVARLDGYTVADVKGLIDRGIAPSQQGNILLDEKSEWIKTPGNTWLADASARLKKLPGWENRIELETGSKVLREEPNVFGYYSWGSNDPAIIFRHLHLEFVPGAIAGEFVSTDARTFQEPPADWQVRDKPFKGTPQSLIGDLIRDGITGVAGHVAEPYLNATIRPDILFPAYVSGFNLVESFYLAMPYV